MSKCPIITVCLLLLISSIGKGDESAIKQIRDRYNQIENFAKETLTTEFNLAEDPQEGRITQFVANNQIQKILVEWGGEHGGVEENFYYWNGELFFAFKSDSHWTFTGKTLANGESETVDKLVEYRLYFKDKACIRSLKKQFQGSNQKEISKNSAATVNQPFTDAALISKVQQRGIEVYQLFANSSLKEVLGGF